MSFYQDLETRLGQTMQADRQRLGNLLRAIRNAEQEGRPFDQNLARLQEQLDQSLARRAARQGSVPPLVYGESLPVVGRREEIAAAIREHQVVVVCGETGSGKSTQIPKICLGLGRGAAGLIGHTQPRRIAARSIAARLSEELASNMRKLVAFKVRFADESSPDTLIKVMTDGVLLAESQTDRYFDQYDTLIIDEAHERTLNIDFLLGRLHRILPQRPDLRLIITSATIDAQRFAEHFRRGAEAVPIIEVSGRAFPVEVLYRPLTGDEGEIELDEIRGAADAVEELCRLGRGDILVFLPTEWEIRAVAQKLRGRQFPGGAPEILPLYARLSTAEQNRVFQTHAGRRIVLATNVAESSLTVPGIHFVVDTGTARVSRYSPRSKVQRLPIEAVSQASADQRKGRCGRIAPGVCIRLYSEEDYLARDKFTSPEIQRTNLAAVILQTMALHLGPVEDFPFLDPPRPEAIRDGYKTLFELGATDAQRGLTPLGRRLARLPVDPRLGRIILAGEEEGCLADVLIVTAALETQDPRDRPADQQEAADNAHAAFADPHSDFIGLLKLWDFVHHLKESVTRGQFRKACRQNFLSEVRIKEWQDVHRQLLEMVQQEGRQLGKRRYCGAAAADGAVAEPIYAAIHRALLQGLLANIALRGETGEYTGAGGNKFWLWPGSGVFVSKPKWVTAAELVETSKRYIRTVAQIDPDWIEPLAGHLVTCSYSEPHWDRKSAAALALEKVSLFGLVIVPRRRIRYGRIEPAMAREIFIRSALVADEYDTRAPFFAHNRRLRDELAKLAAKTRDRELLVNDETVFDFYDQRLPAEVYDGATLDQWRKPAEAKQPRQLFMTHEDLLPRPCDAPEERFPEKLTLERLQLPLEYHFEPGSERDGITATVPREGLGQLSADRLGWLVPGMLQEKLQALIRSLPKDVRRALGPAPEAAQRAAATLVFGQRSLLEAAADALGRLAEERLTPAMFDLSRIPPHLFLKVRVIDERGKVLAEGRDLNALRGQLGQDAAPAPPAPEMSAWHRDGLVQWDFDELPVEIEIQRAGLALVKYPALVDAGETVSLRLLETRNQAEQATRGGLRRLFVLAENRELKAQVQWLPNWAQFQLQGASLTAQTPLDRQLIDLFAERAAFGGPLPISLPRTKGEFGDWLKARRKFIVPSVQEATPVVAALLAAFHAARLAFEKMKLPNVQYAADDLRRQLAELMVAGFLVNTPWEWLRHCPRYLQAISLRIQKLISGGQQRDRQNHDLIARFAERLTQRGEEHRQQGLSDPELVIFRWMLEEMRVSLFAQELGTSLPISPQRLEKQWAKVR